MSEYMIQIGDEVREMTESEIKTLEKARADNAKIDQMLQAAVLAKQSGRRKLAALGLTDDEIAALVG